jgi:hypothetical protein
LDIPSAERLARPSGQLVERKFVVKGMYDQDSTTNRQSDKIICTMPRSSSLSSDDNTDYALELQNFLEKLSQNTEREPVGSEIEGGDSSAVSIDVSKRCPRSSAVHLRRLRDPPLASIGIEREENAHQERWNNTLRSGTEVSIRLSSLFQHIKRIINAVSLHPTRTSH